MQKLARSPFLSLGKEMRTSHMYSSRVRVLFHQCLCSRTGVAEAEEMHFGGTKEGVFCFLLWAL